MGQNKSELKELQNEIKNSIKSLWIKDKENTKTINDYAGVINKIKEEYALVYKENLALKNLAIEDMKTCAAPQHLPSPQQNYYKQPKKRVMHNYIEDDDKNDDVQYVVKKGKSTCKKIIYEDYVDEKMIMRRT